MEKKIDFELNKKEKNVNYYTTIGILQPILQNRWRILFNNNRKVKVPQEGKSNILAMQATKCKINYLKKEVNVEIEQSTIGDEKKHNPRLAGKTMDEFVAIMDNLNLPKQKEPDIFSQNGG